MGGAAVGLATEFFKTAIRVNALSGAIALATGCAMVFTLDEFTSNRSVSAFSLGRLTMVPFSLFASLLVYDLSLSLSQTSNGLIIGSMIVIPLALQLYLQKGNLGQQKSRI